MAESDSRLGSIEAAYRENYRPFLHVATAITGDPELAADAVQEAFVRAITRRQTYRGGGPLEGWLWRILVNTARDVLARRRDIPTESLPEEAGSAAGNGVEVRAAIAALPERQRLVLFLRYFADLDYETIGQVLDVSSGTVGATLHNAHAALRARVEEVQLG